MNCLTAHVQQSTNFAGYCAGASLDIGPRVSERLHADDGVRVIPVAVGPSLFRRVCHQSVEFDRKQGLLVKIVDIAALATDDGRGLPRSLRQPVGALDIADVPALKQRQNSGADVTDGD